MAVASLEDLANRPTAEIAVVGTPLVLRTLTVGQASVALRPINTELFIDHPSDYEATFNEFLSLLAKLSSAKGAISSSEKEAMRASRTISRALYTTLQAAGATMDYLCSSQHARKNYGMRFEELIEAMFEALGLGHEPINFGLSYTAEGVPQIFNNQVDLVISKKKKIESTRTRLDAEEVVTSIKTSSKDRFAKIFLDKELLRTVTGQEIPVVALFHNDVQRSGIEKISWTFVAGNFIAYVSAFGPLTGVYYVDPPIHITKAPWKKYLRTFEDLLLEDLWTVVF